MPAANAGQAVRRASRRRPTSTAAAAPNNSIIGGAGTSVPLEVLPVEVLPELVDVDVEVDVEELVLDEVEELVLVETLPDVLVLDEVLVLFDAPFIHFPSVYE